MALATHAQLGAVLATVLVAGFLPGALVTNGWFAIGVCAGVAVGCWSVLVRSAARRHESLDGQLMRLRACDPKALCLDPYRERSDDASLELLRGLVEAALRIGMTGTLDLATTSSVKLEMRRLTAGVAALVEAVPEDRRHVEVPILHDLAASIDRGIAQLEGASAHLADAATAMDGTAAQTLTTSVREVLAESLIGPANIAFEGWQLIEVRGADGQVKPLPATGVEIARGETLRLNVLISEGNDVPGATPLAARGSETPDAVEFRVEARGIGVTLDATSHVLRWRRDAGGAAIAFEAVPRSERSEVFLTTYLGPRLMQSARLTLVAPASDSDESKPDSSGPEVEGT